MKLPLYSNIINQLPQFVRDDHPTFVTFIEAYYEWLHNQNVATGIDKGLIDLKDVDKTLDQFLDYIILELTGIDAGKLAVDKRLFIKHLHDLFASKGSEKSFKLFFRLFYDIGIDVSYPSENILRASDGEWNSQRSLTLDLLTGVVGNLPNSVVTGLTSGATASIEYVESIWLSYDGFVQKATINNSSLRGTFIAGETIVARSGTTEEVTLRVRRTLTGIRIVSGGIRYAEGDVINISSATGAGARAVVTKTSQPSQIKLNANYSKIGTTVTIDLGSTYHLLEMGDFVFLEFPSGIATGNYSVTNINNDFIFQISSSPAETIVSGSVDVYNAGNSGKIFEVSMVDHGIDYEDASFTITTAGGTGAVLEGIYGTISKFTGRWTSERGLLSNSSIVLEDNHKYQQFSYVIKSSESILIWKDLFKRLMHPAGLELFSETEVHIFVKTNLVNVNQFVDVNYFIETDSLGVSGDNYYNCNTSTSVNAVGYNTLKELNRIQDNIPPIHNEFQFNQDARDAIYKGTTDYNYTGSVNEGYWGIITPVSDDFCFGSATYGSTVFLGYTVDILLNERNFKIEEIYNLTDVANGASISHRSVIVPDSTITIII